MSVHSKEPKENLKIEVHAISEKNNFKCTLTELWHKRANTIG